MFSVVCTAFPAEAPEKWTAKVLGECRFDVVIDGVTTSGSYRTCRATAKKANVKDGIEAYRKAAIEAFEAAKAPNGQADTILGKEAWGAVAKASQGLKKMAEASGRAMFTAVQKKDPIPYKGVDPYSVSLSSAKTKADRINLSRARKGLAAI